MVEAAPGAASQAVGALEARDVGLDAGAEVPELRLRWLRVCFGISGLKPKPTRNRRGLLAEKRDSSNYFNSLQFVDGH